MLWLRSLLMMVALLALWPTLPTWSHNEDPDGCRKYLKPIVDMVLSWSPSKAGYAPGNRYYVEGYGFPDAPILELHFRILPEEFWAEEKGKKVPTYFITPTSYWLDLNGDGLQERWFSDYGANLSCEDMGHFLWNPQTYVYELVNPHGPHAPHNGKPRDVLIGTIERSIYEH